MRGQDMRTGSIFSYVDIAERIPASHPLRKIHEFVHAALAALDATFAPERMQRAALIQILFSIRPECQRALEKTASGFRSRFGIN
jgi:hypothetical protein